MLKNALIQFGLSKNEADIYLFLLKHGGTSPNQIAAGTNISRPNTYPVLQSLEGKGLVSTQSKGSKRVFLAKDPEALYRTIERQQETIQSILPELRALHAREKHKPSIQFFEGKEQIKEVYLKSLEAKEIFAIGSTHSLDTVFPKFFPSWIEKVRGNKIIFNDILTHASKESAGPMMKDVLKGYYDVGYLPSLCDDLPTDILIWDNNIALITLTEPFFATVLTNNLLSKSFKMIFEVLKERL